MESILHTFGIDWRLLLVNAVNFGLLLVGLTYFLYKPLTNMLEERRRKVEEGVRAARASEAKLKEVEASRAAVLAEAGKEAETLLAGARSAGSAKERDLIRAGEAAAATLIKDAEAEALELKAKALQESKQELAKLIVLGVEKALRPGSGQATK